MRCWMQLLSTMPRIHGQILLLSLYGETLGKTSFLRCVLWMLEALDSVRISCKMWPVLCLLPECLNNTVFSRSFQIPTGYNCGHCVMQVVPLVFFLNDKIIYIFTVNFKKQKLRYPRKIHIRMAIQLKRFQFVSLRWLFACPSFLLPFSELNAWTTRSVCVRAGFL